jgi:hypothetical protein
MNILLVLLFTLPTFANKAPNNSIDVEGKYTIELHLAYDRYPTVGSLHLNDGKYQFIADKNYKSDNFKSEFYYKNPKGTYDIHYELDDFSKLEDGDIIGTVNFLSSNQKKHEVLLRFDKDRNELYFHATVSKIEPFKISKPLK